MTTENLSLLETKHLVEKSRGKLTMLVLRDDRKFLVSIPEVEDSPQNSADERHEDSSSELEGELSYYSIFTSLLISKVLITLFFLDVDPKDISDLDVGAPANRTSRPRDRRSRK